MTKFTAENLFDEWFRVSSELTNSIGKQKMDNYFFIKSGYKIQKILIDEIIYIESMGDYVRFFLEDKKIVTLLSLSKIIKLLPQEKFIQIHRSYIINFEKINFIQNNIISIGQYQLPISKSRKKELMEIINLKLL